MLSLVSATGQSKFIRWVIARNKYYGAITKRMNFDCPVVETCESIEPNVEDLELNAIAYTFSKIFEPELKQLLRRS